MCMSNNYFGFRVNGESLRRAIFLCENRLESGGAVKSICVVRFP